MSNTTESMDKNSIILDDGTLLIGRLTAPEVYCEGITQMMMGAPISRVVFHSVVEPQKNGAAEVRRVAATICMPTTSLVEMALNILSAVKENEERYIQSTTATADAGVAIIKSFRLDRQFDGNMK